MYEFDDFRLDARGHRLYRSSTGKLIPLTPKAVELLMTLVRSDGRLLTKDELLDTVWAGSIVEEANLSQTIFVLRKALGESTKEPRFILTVPNHGYRFIAAVNKSVVSGDKSPDEGKQPDLAATMPLQENRSGRGNRTTLLLLAVTLTLILAVSGYWFYPQAKQVTVRDVRSIAVLPFEDIGDAADEKYLGIGLADALIGKFSSLRQITVSPTRSVSKYAETRDDAVKIGHDLKVDAVLDGRIQHVGDRVRVSVQLIRTSDNATIWTENIDDDFTNFFAIQDSISQKVVESLALQLDPIERRRFDRRGTQNAAAYEEYLRGRFFWNKRTADGLEKAVEHFTRAVTIEPDFALAYAGLAETWSIYNFYSINFDDQAFPKARAAALRALEIDSELAEAHAALGLVRSQYDFDWSGAEQSYLRSIELNPNYPTVRQWYGEFLAFRGRPDESFVQMRKAIELDPTSLATNTAPALTYNILRQPDKTLEVTGNVLEMDPNFAFALHYRARALKMLRRYDEAIEIYLRVIAASNASTYFKADLGCLYAESGHETEARQILAELYDTAKQHHVSPYNFAILHHALGENELTFEFLRKTVAQHDSFVVVIPVAADFDDIKTDPRFIEVLRSANL